MNNVTFTLNKVRNMKYEFFYSKILNLCEKECELFFELLHKPLQSIVRFNKTSKKSEELKKMIIELCKKNEILFEPLEISKNERYRNQIFRLELDKNKLKKKENYNDLHKLVADGMEYGLLSRQELVSMIPPILLDVSPGHFVLDMCSSPGSKTTQILEDLNEKEDLNGFVIANDNSSNRCQVLHHQLKRMRYSNFLVTQINAEEFPISPMNDGKELQYDRILCDVPCSGDAVIRKYVDHWNKWTPLKGIRHHKLQLNILLKGAELLKQNGILVYSTCSFHPAENEAVIAEFLRRTNQNESNEFYYEIIDCFSEFDDKFKVRKGLYEWEIYIENKYLDKNYSKMSDKENGNDDEIKTKNEDNNLIVIENDLSELKSDMIENNEFLKTNIPSSIFSSNNHELKEQLIKTVRIYPNDNDSSGFFIAKLKKIKKDKKDVISKIKKIKINPNFKSPYLQNQLVSLTSKDFYKQDVSITKDLIDSIIDFYGIKSSFNPSWLITKSDKIRKIYICKGVLSNILCTKNIKLRSYAAGLRAFEITSYKYLDFISNKSINVDTNNINTFSNLDKVTKNINNNDTNTDLILPEKKEKLSNQNKLISDYHYRITSDCLNILVPYMTKRIVKIQDKEIFDYLIQNINLNIDELINNNEFKILKNHKQFLNEITEITEGCFVIILNCSFGDINLYFEEALTCIKFRSNLYVQISKEKSEIIYDDSI